MRQVGIVFKRKSPEAIRKASEAVRFLRDRGVRAVVEPSAGSELSDVEVVPTEDFGRQIEFVVCLGGDGTLLYAAGVLKKDRVPVLGVNMGTMGFLTPFLESELQGALDAALEGGLPMEERMRLSVTLKRPGRTAVEGVATNDAVITQGSLARLLELEARMDGQVITAYRADGLIVSTPTGSTAYNLAAGGPILNPAMEAICLSPICPHSLTQRPLVLPAATQITVEVGGSADKVSLTIDGQRGHEVGTGDVIRVGLSDCPLVLFRPTTRTFFDILKTKLMWGERQGLDPSNGQQP